MLPARLFVALSAALSISLGLVGCATLPANPTGTIAPRADAFSPPVTSQLRTEMAAKGWLFQSDAQTNTSKLLIFVKPQTLTRTGNFARFLQLDVRETPLRIGANWIYATMYLMQFDCVARTRQVLAADLYTDRSTNVRVEGMNRPLELQQVRLGGIDDTLLLRACSNAFGSGQTAALPPSGAGPTGAAPARNSSGSGIVLAKSSVVTNQHVVASCGKVEVVYNGQRFPATVKKRDAKNDLALLQVDSLSLATYPSLRNRAVSGEGVMVAGYPLAGLLSSDMIVTDGIVNALSGIANNASQLQISAPVQPGNSGGPLIDKSGALVGVVVSKLNALRAAAVTGDVPQNINFAIKPEVLQLFLESENLPIRKTDQGARLDTEVLAEKAKSFTLKVECKNS